MFSALRIKKGQEKMICKNCGKENNHREKYCEECGAELEVDEAVSEAGEVQSEEPEAQQEMPIQDENSYEDADGAAGLEDSDESDQPKSNEVKEALERLERYEEGTITHPGEKPREKRSFWCPENPVLWSFLWLLGFGAVLGGLTALFFAIDLDGTQIIFGITFAIFTAAVLGLDFTYYLPAALTLDKMFKGKGVRLEYQLRDAELQDLAELAKKRNRGFYLAIGLFALAFTIYYIYILATAIVQTKLMWISLIFSICVFVISALLFFLMPKYNYLRMMQGGRRVLIGESSVYYGGNYYHWRRVQPKATFANINKHRLYITFVQEFKNGNTQRHKVEVYLPERELKNGTALVSSLESSAKAYQEGQLKSAVRNEKQNKKKK